MQTARPCFGAPEWFLVIGGSIFIVVLAVSAAFEADIRWLHFFQAWMYIAAMWLGVRGSRWGYFIGISAAGLWDYANIFVTTFFINGLGELVRLVQTGQLQRPDQLIAVPAWFSNLAVVIGCVWGYWRVREKPLTDGGKFLLAFVLTTGFFLLDVTIFQPRYLPLFRGMLHPHLP